MNIDAYAIGKTTAISNESKIMSGYILRIASFVRWPTSDKKEIKICIVGTDIFGNFIDEMISARPKTRNNMQINIARRSTGKNISDCNIAFVNKTDVNKTFWKTVKQNSSILLISDHPDFINNGGLIRFYKENRRIRIELDLDLIRAANLEVSSELLKVVKVIRSNSFNKRTFSSK